MPHHGRSHGRSHGRHHHHHHHHTRRRPVILIPPSNAACIVFPFDQASRKFKTENYNPSQTQDRASLEEIEMFLNELNEPVNAWYDKYLKKSDLGGVLTCLFICLLILCPPFLIGFICWSTSQETESLVKKEELKLQATQVIAERIHSWTDRKLTWKVPLTYPYWIELWTGQSLPQMQPGFGQPGIQTMMMQQGQPGMNTGMGNNSFQPSQQGNGPMMSPNQSGYPLRNNQNQFQSYGANTYGQSVEEVNL